MMENKGFKPAGHKVEHKIVQPVHQKKKFYNDFWKMAVLVLAVLLVAAVLTKGFSFGKKLSKDDVKKVTEDYVNALTQGQASAQVTEVTEEAGLYKLKLNVGGRLYDSYVTKDGKLLFPQAVDMSADLNQPAADSTANAAPAAEVPKTDKPAVELFVMAYCPYGTQAEKGMLPAVRALGSKVDFKIRFVYYAMHGEKEVKENLNQYCIQKEQSDKFQSYLACFLNASDSAGCLKTANVDTAKMNACTAAADKQYSIMANLNDKSKWLSGNYPLFGVDAALNTKYGVGGSPTLVINGVESSAGRDSASYLKAICGAFKTQPKECSTQLSSASPSAGFGYGTTTDATAAGCGA
jgi:hypothetical protein